MAVFLFFIVALWWTPAAAADSVLEVRLETSDLVYDPVRDRIYASIPASALSGPNRVVRINPATGAIEAGVSVLTNPGKLAISDDGQFLYVAVTNGTAVQRITLATLTAAPPFSLGADGFFGAYSVEDMAVVPGSPQVLAVSRKNTGVSPRHAGVAIYDNGIQRPATTQRHTGSNVIEFGSATRLYGYNNESTEFGFRRLTVDASGVTEVDVARGVLRGFSSDIVFDGGRIYASNGQVLDAEPRTLAGQLPGIQLFTQRLIRPDAALGRVFGLDTSSVPRLVAWDAVTFRIVGALEIPTAAGTLSSLLRWGTDGLAFRTDRNQLFLVRTSLVAGADADLGITMIGPDAVPVGRAFTYALVVSNNGPATATEVLVSDQIPAGVTFVSATASQGSCTGTTTVMCAIGEMAAGALVAVNVTVRATATQALTNTASVSATTTDPHPANDTASLTTSVTPPAVTHAIRRLNLDTGDLVYDPVSRRIYASVPGDSPAGGNSVVAMDPETGALAPPVFVGSEPGKLARSDDGQFVYVGLEGVAAVRRVDVASATAGLQFMLGSDSFFGPFFAEDIAVMPSEPRVVAVSRRNGSTHLGVGIYDDGVRRPLETPRFTGSNIIEFSESPTRLYGYNNESTEFGFRRMNVDAGGVSVVDVTQGLIGGFSADIVFDAGRVYTTTGQVIDPEARLSLGTFAGGTGLVRPDSGFQRVFFFDGTTLRAFDMATRAPLGSLVIPGATSAAGRLIRWGGGGLAFRTTDGQLFLIETSLLPGSATDLAVTLSDAPDPVAVDGQVMFTVGIENRGPQDATGVVVGGALPAGMTPQSATASQGTCVIAPAVSCELGALANGGTATVTIVARATQAGVQTTTVTVSSALFEIDTTNNSATAVTTAEPRRPLTVKLTGTGQGTVTSDPAGIQCGPTCTALFDSGGVVALQPQADADSFFAGWTGDADCVDGQVTMTAAKTCTARFSRRPDLIVTALTGPALGGAGGKITVSATVRNQAPAPAAAGAFTVGIYLLPSPVFDRDQARLLGSRVVGGLGPGASSAASTTVMIPADATACLCFLAVVADDADTVPELDEANNVRVAAVAIGITRPELVVTALTGPAKVGTGQRITLNTTVRNSASPPATAGTFTVGLYLSDSATFDSGTALLLGRRTVSSLAGGGVSSGGTTVTVPAGLTDGAYFLFAVADDGAAVFEADEGNNVFAAASPLVVVRPDLTIGSASASVTPARLVTVSAIIQNGVTPGAAPAFAVGIYLSPTAEFDPGTARLLHRRPLTGLAGGARTTVQATLPIPGDVPAGAQFVAVVADDGDVVPESNETNNVRVVTPEITVVPPELIVTAVSGPVAAGAGSAIPVVTTIRNLGAWAAATFTIGIYLSPTTTFDLSASRLLGGPRLRGLGAGATHTATTSVTVPPDVVTGTYFLVAVADVDNEVVETTRANNVLVASRVIDIVRPDLTVTAVSGPALAATGQAIGVMVTAQNLAPVPGNARSFTIGVYLGTPPELGPRIGAATIASLAPTRSVTARVGATIPLDVETGSYVLTARIDDAGTLPEEDEGNNMLAAAASISVVRPDLEVTTVTAPPAAIAGQTISATVTVKNAGPPPASAGPFSVDLFLSPDGADPLASCTIEPCPRRVGGRTVAKLGPGALSAAATSFKVPADLPPGAYVLHAIVDREQRIPESNEGNNTLASAPMLIVPDVRGTTRVGANGAFSACSDPSLESGFALPMGSLAITSQTRERFSGTATFVLADPDVTFGFVFRLAGAVDLQSQAAGSYTVGITANGVTVLNGEGTFAGRVHGDVDFTLEGQLRDGFDECHMTLNVFELPLTAASADRATVRPGLPPLLQRAR